MYDELFELVEKWRKLSDSLYNRFSGYVGDFVDGRADSLESCADDLEKILDMKVTITNRRENGKD